MKFITPILLITKSIKTDNIGDQSVIEDERKVFCNKVSIGTKEFYEAHSSGMKPEIKVELRAIEYKEEQYIKLDGIYYDVIRTYNKQNGIVEITCSRGNKNVST